MNNISITQSTNYLALAGAIVVIAKLFKFELDVNTVEALIGAVAIIVVTVISIINRYKKGDITIAGIRK